MNQSGLRALVAASTLSMVLGQVHAFSIYLTAAEAKFAVGRSVVGFTYSLALIALTIAVLFGPAIYGRLSAAAFSALALCLGVAGLLVASVAPSIEFVWLGYGIVFGVANGLGYGFALQISAQANRGSKGMAMGVVTAAYALGAVLAAPLLGWVVGFSGFSAGMLTSAISLISALPVVVILFRWAGTVFSQPETGGPKTPFRRGRLAWLWLGYALAVMSGLMVIGHASGIATQRSVPVGIWVAPILVALFNLAGSFVAAWASDRVGARNVLVAMPCMTALALFVLAATGTDAVVLPALCLIGFAYGGTIAVWPVAIATIFGLLESPRIYGRVFTAWGTAGLAGPWLAGATFDATGDYQIAFLVAGLMAFLGTGVAAWVLKA